MYKAKTLDTNKWVFGSLIKESNHLFIQMEKVVSERYNIIGHTRYRIAPETICRSIGVNDRQGKPIYENDINPESDIIAFCQKGLGYALKHYCKQEKRVDFCYCHYCSYYTDLPSVIDSFEVVGNIFD